MNILRSIAMAFSMFSGLPMPWVEWKKENMQYMLAMLPLVGCVESMLLLVWLRLAEYLAVGAVLFAAGMTILPVLYTGGIHLDGFCDTVDALSSHATPEKKREILKDPRAGAFAVIFAAAYLLALFALYTELPRQGKTPLLACLIPVISRTASGFAGVCFPVSGEEGMLSTFHRSAHKRGAVMLLLLWLAFCVSGVAVIHIWMGLAMLVAAGMCSGYVYVTSQKEFGGMSGDLAGYLLQISELAMLLVVVFMGKVMIL